MKYRDVCVCVCVCVFAGSSVCICGGVNVKILTYLVSYNCLSKDKKQKKKKDTKQGFGEMT